MTLEQLLDHAADFAVTQFTEIGKVHPMWIMESPIFPTTVPITPEHWTSALEKHRTYEALRRMFFQLRVERYACMNEAWAVAFTDPAEMQRHIGKLAKHEDRREIISIVAADASRSIQRTYYILRPEHGRATLRRDPRDFAGTAHGSGDLGSLLCRVA